MSVSVFVCMCVDAKSNFNGLFAYFAIEPQMELNGSEKIWKALAEASSGGVDLVSLLVVSFNSDETC